MLINKLVVLVSLFSAVAYAGPTISVKVKNAGTVPIYSTPTGVNDSSTQLKSSPTPIASIPPGSVNGFSGRIQRVSATTGCLEKGGEMR